MTPTTTEPEPEVDRLVLYDGECVLCNSSVDFLLRLDTEGVFLFAPLQGATAGNVLERHDRSADRLDSIVYVRGFRTDRETVFEKSTAVLRALEDLGGIWWLFSLLRYVPTTFRDWVYDFVADNRYRWFGRYDQCRIPDDDRDRFLD